MAVLGSMAKHGALTPGDLDKCRDILGKKYGLSLCSIFR